MIDKVGVILDHFCKAEAKFAYPRSALMNKKEIVLTLFADCLHLSLSGRATSFHWSVPSVTVNCCSTY